MSYMGAKFCKTALHNSYFCAIALLKNPFWPSVAKRQQDTVKEYVNLGVNFCAEHDTHAATQCHPADQPHHELHQVPFFTGLAVSSGASAADSPNMRNPWSSKAVIGQSTNANASSSVAQKTKIAGHRRGTSISTSSLWNLYTLEQHTEPASPLQVQGFLTRRHRVSSQGKTTSWKPAEEASWADVELFFTKQYRASAKRNVYKEQVHSTPVPTYHQEQGEPPK